MTKNMGTTDKLIRLILAAAILALYFFDVISGTLGIILVVVAAIFALTSFISFCPAYLPFGISTCSTKEK